MTHKLATGAIDIGELKGMGTLGTNLLTNAEGPEKLTLVINMILATLTIVASVFLLIKILLAGIAIITSDGDKAKLAQARSSITSAVIGLVVVITAVIFMNIIALVLGVKNLLWITWIIPNITP